MRFYVFNTDLCPLPKSINWHCYIRREQESHWNLGEPILAHASHGKAEMALTWQTRQFGWQTGAKHSRMVFSPSKTALPIKFIHSEEEIRLKYVI